MRKFFFLITAFTLVLSCSSDETSTPVTPPAPTVKYTITLSAGEGGAVSTTGGEYEAGETVSVTATPQGEYLFKDWSDGNTDATRTITVNSNSTLTANFEKKKYPLTVNIEGEGEVLEEIVNAGRTTEYDSGTTVKLTAVPAEGWSVFKKWSGSVNSTETSIEINISEPTTINAVFEESNFIVTKNRTRIEVEGVVLEDIRATFSDVSGSFYYTHNGNEYFFNSGNRWISGELWNTSLDPQSLPKTPHLILKKFDNKWLLDQVHRVSATRLVRNPVKYGNQLIIADSGEIGNNADLWLGDAWIGELVPDNIEWRKINPDGEKTFWHGVTAGDINGDGLTDIGGVPAPDYRLYVQNQDGTFSNQRNIWSYSDSNDSPFTIAFIDVDGDGRDEIITADYGEQNQNQLNNVQTYKYNDKNERFERIFVSNEPEAFYSLSECPRGLGGTSIKASDFNNDGNVDISVAREDSCGSAFEVWLGDGNGEFKPHWSNFFRGTDLQNWREFKLMDVNNDNNMDIVLRPDGYGSLFRISPVQYDPVASGGVKLNNSIWINDGQGNFSAYENKELEIKDVFVDFLEPFMKDGILHFIGTTTLPDDAHYGEDAITLSIYDIKVRIE